MSSDKKYKEIFIKSLNLKNSDFNENIKYNDVAEWDSIGHMNLISALEGEFKISIDTDDVVEFSSFKVGIKILKKYKVKF